MSEKHTFSAVDYHLQSIRCSMVREWLGGVKAEDSYLMQDAVAALLKDGLTEEEIIAKYREKWPQ